jgi:hypothetical protein
MKNKTKPEVTEHRELQDYANKHKKGIRLADGVYDATGIDFLVVNQNKEKVIAWVNSHDKFWVANTYEMETTILLAEEPKRTAGDTGFSYGPTNVIIGLPSENN